MRPEEYKGQEWIDLLQALDQKQLRNTLRKAYRRVAKPLVAKARASLDARGPRVKGNQRDWKAGLRAHIYSKGGGFSITMKSHNKKGYHVNRFGKEKPILRWAEEGTKERFTRIRGFISRKGSVSRGEMPRYGFLAAVEPQIYTDAENSLQSELEAAVVSNAKKYGWI